MNSLGAGYSGTTAVELWVREEDANAAREILARSPDDLEPVDDPGDALPVLGENGVMIQLVAIASYEKMRDFRDAAAVLASARIRIFPPALRSRGDRPPDPTKRFILKVGQPDEERATQLLAQSRADDQEEDDPRCPKCNSWRVVGVSQFLNGLKAFFGLGPWPAREMECLACGHKARPAEFGAKA